MSTNSLMRFTSRLCALLLLGLSAPVMAAYELNMTEGVTEISREVYSLHMTIFWVCVAIGAVVFGVMIYSIIYHRKSKGAEPADFHESTTVEIIWTIMPFIILIGMAIPAAGTLIKMDDTANADMTIKITGYQWKWKYDYMEEGVSFVSTLDAASNAARQLDSGIDPNTVENYLLNVDKPLVVPINKKIVFLVTSGDVIHSWWVPAFSVKKDAMPGIIKETWTKIDEPGTYRGVCAELCGRDHGFMPIVVEAKTQEDYDKWLAAEKAKLAAANSQADKTWTMKELMAKGKDVYGANCSGCHQTNGEGLPASGFPALKASPVAMGDKAKHVDVVLSGVSGTAMAGYLEVLTDAELAAVITYERNAWGNNKGDLVQPKDIKAAR